METEFSAEMIKISVSSFRAFLLLLKLNNVYPTWSPKEENVI